MRIWVLLLLNLFAWSAGADDRALAFSGKGENGKIIHFDPGRLERPAILLFWVTWCPYCKALMPHIQKVYEAAGSSRLDVYAIDFEEDGDPVAELKKRKQTFTLVLEGNAIAGKYAVIGTPALFLVDRQGRIVYRRNGGDAPKKVEQALREHLGLATR
jgi:cytochrome c biogenesis protein CcmG, thiol:disulfide interchange protein DsbE